MHLFNVSKLTAEAKEKGGKPETNPKYSENDETEKQTINKLLANLFGLDPEIREENPEGVWTHPNLEVKDYKNISVSINDASGLTFIFIKVPYKKGLGGVIRITHQRENNTLTIEQDNKTSKPVTFGPEVYDSIAVLVKNHGQKR